MTNAEWRQVTKTVKDGGGDVTPGPGLRARLIVWYREHNLELPTPVRKGPAFKAADAETKAETETAAQKEAARKAKKAQAERERRARKKAEAGK